ncbi:MAG: hypothetical protein H0T92_06730 [Pyrinomonadaceae bacterium]|nr:hypothetical protein [Pyrinomonadaceae bacterium]
MIAPDPLNDHSTTLELDKLWSFVLKKVRRRWIWMALCRQTRQVVAYAVGDRSRATCHKLWEAIPEAYRTAHCRERLLESLPGCDPSRATHGGRYQEWADGACGAVEQHTTATARTLCSEYSLVFQVIEDA